MPRSPCSASAGCRNTDGVPVEENVAAIFRPISPDLPMPVTTTRPLQASSSLHRALEFPVQPRRQLLNRFRLDPQNAPRRLQTRRRIHRRFPWRVHRAFTSRPCRAPTNAPACRSRSASPAAPASDPAAAHSFHRTSPAPDCRALRRKSRPRPRRIRRAPAAR